MKIIGFVFKIIICSILFFIIGIGVVIVLLNFELNWQVILYLLTAGILFAGTLFTVFAKTNKKAKFIFTILFIIFMFMPRMLPYIKHIFDVDACIDSEICSEKNYK